MCRTGAGLAGAAEVGLLANGLVVPLKSGFDGAFFSGSGSFLGSGFDSTRGSGLVSDLGSGLASSREAGGTHCLFYDDECIVAAGSCFGGLPNPFPFPVPCWFCPLVPVCFAGCAGDAALLGWMVSDIRFSVAMS